MTKAEISINKLIADGEEILNQIEVSLKFDKEHSSLFDGFVTTFNHEIEYAYKNWFEAVKNYLHAHKENFLLFEIEENPALPFFEELGKSRYLIDRELSNLGITTLKEKVKECLSSQIKILRKYVATNLDKRKGDAKKETFSLSNKVIMFDEALSVIKFGRKTCPLPPAKNESCLAKVMLSRKPGEFVDWSIVYQEMTGDSELGGKENLKSVRDTMYHLNKRIKEDTGATTDFLGWKNKSLKRNY